jgi:hypothetical protein
MKILLNTRQAYKTMPTRIEGAKVTGSGLVLQTRPSPTRTLTKVRTSLTADFQNRLMNCGHSKSTEGQEFARLLAR